MSTPIFAIYENSFDLTLTISSALVTDGNKSYSFAVDIEVVMQLESRGCNYCLLNTKSIFMLIALTVQKLYPMILVLICLNKEVCKTYSVLITVKYLS